MSKQLMGNSNFLPSIMLWLDRTFVSKEKKYLFINYHGDSLLHYTMKYSTAIFPSVTADGTIEPARPIFFFEEE
jgi:hypothetical protein